MGADVAQQVVRDGRSADEFARLHRAFVEHFGIAASFAWLASAVAAVHAPWTHNIRGLIDPLGRVESTASFLFGIPVVMTLAWVIVACGGDVLRRGQVLRSQALEFVLAGAIAFAVFCMAIGRVVTAMSLAS